MTIGNKELFKELVSAVYTKQPLSLKMSKYKCLHFYNSEHMSITKDPQNKSFLKTFQGTLYIIFNNLET